MSRFCAGETLVGFSAAEKRLNILAGARTKNRGFRRVIPDTLPQCSLLKKGRIKIRIGAGTAISRTPFFERNWKRAGTARSTELYVGRRDQGEFVQCGMPMRASWNAGDMGCICSPGLEPLGSGV